MSPLRFVNAWSLAVLLVGSGASAACTKHHAQSELPEDEIVVAKVNGTVITRYDVDQIAHQSLGELVVAAGTDSFAKAREAVVQSRAIALAAEAELSERDKQTLTKETAAYREQLLVRRYLKLHAPPAPVTPEMVRRYYLQHPERFGAKVERTYELLGSSRALASAERDKLLKALSGIESQADWQAVADKLVQDKLPVSLTVTNSSDKTLDQNLRDLLRQLQVGHASQVTFVQGRAYVARVKGEDKRPPRPLEEVRTDIEQLLMPSQLSAAIESASKQVLSRTKVEVLEPGAAHSASGS